MVHLQTKEGLKAMDMVAFHTEVENEVKKGIDLMVSEDYYLMDIELDKLLQEPLELLRGWLWSMKLAMGTV